MAITAITRIAIMMRIMSRVIVLLQFELPVDYRNKKIFSRIKREPNGRKHASTGWQYCRTVVKLHDLRRKFPYV
jgi:hypothetical protein